MFGKTLNHYEIGEQIGAGGMGAVYRAKDQKLGRDVAIKVLPEEFAKDGDRVARFQREAKLLASLNHSNIAAIYGLEESGKTNFLVLELVEGETLADRIKAGPIPVEESLKLALQIAEALEAAHEKGVIHRDLKPANIKVTPDGKVKVLDFGLAKAYAGEQEKVNLPNSPTLSDAATQQGVILGTAAYMSPEQARGKVVDKRADIWAFGCILYEMITGQAAFQGEDVTEILASVVKGGANLDLLPAGLHPRVQEAIIRCLQKDLKKRYRDIADAQYEIEQAMADAGVAWAQPIAAAGPQSRWRLFLPWIAAAVISSVVLTGLVVRNLKKVEPPQVMRFDCELPEGQQFAGRGLPILAVSPDGRQFVYSTSKGLYLRSVEELTAKLIAGTEGLTQSPFFSPDGKWIGYFSLGDRKLKKIPVGGGLPVALCDFTQIADASWGADNTIAIGRLSGDIMRISSDGETPEPLVKTKTGGIAPQILPNGKSVLYTSTSAPQKIMVQPPESGQPRELFPGANARYLATGYIVYALENKILAVPFSPDNLSVKGAHVPVVERVYRITAPQYAVSDSGTLVYIPEKTVEAAPGGAIAPGRTLCWVGRRGLEAPIAVSPKHYSDPRISPDGSRVALTIGAGDNSDIWILDLRRDNLMTRLTLEKGEDSSPLWTHDGKRIVYYARGEGIPWVVWRAADGTGAFELLANAPNLNMYPRSWSRNGKTLVLETAFANPGVWGVYDIGMVSMEESHKWKPLLDREYQELQPRISPDGRWLAYTSDESGRFEIYVRPFPDVDGGGKWQVSTNGGDSPLWSPDSLELFYRNGDSVMAVSVETKPAFKPGKSETLFRGTYVSLSADDRNPWEVNLDGKRFLMMKEAAGGPASADRGPRRINVVINWLEELKQRVTVK